MSARDTITTGASERELELLAICSHTMVDINSKLDDLTTLAQQQVDLLRRIVADIEIERRKP